MSSRAAREIVELREDLILQLFLQRGPYWEAIKDLRARWKITPSINVPPPGLNRIVPPDLGKELSFEEWQKLDSQWTVDLKDIKDTFVPERFRTPRTWRTQRTWNSFVSDCVFYHPPEDDLPGFLESCGIGLQLTLPGDWQHSREQKRVAMLEAPIKELRDADRVQHAWWKLYMTHSALLEEVNERFLKPRGLDLDDLISDVLKELPNPYDEFARELEEISQSTRPYIRVDEHTTKDDVLRAFRVLTASQATRPGAGAAKHSRLLCVQYAVLHDKHGWKTRQIADRFEGRTDQKTLRRLNDHIKMGRELLENF